MIDVSAWNVKHCPALQTNSSTSVTVWHWVSVQDTTAVLRWTCCLCTVGQVVHTLPEGQPVINVTSLDNEIFVLRWKGLEGCDEVEVYDVITYRLQRCLTVRNAHGYTDMTSCEHYHCLYIGDLIVGCIHRLEVRGGHYTVACSWWTLRSLSECST